MNLILNPFLDLIFFITTTTTTTIEMGFDIIEINLVIYQNVQISREKGDLSYFIGYLLAGVKR